jgi:hypothetical protein
LDVKIMGHKTPDTEVPSLVTVDNVKVKIHSLTIKMRNSEHQ